MINNININKISNLGLNPESLKSYKPKFDNSVVYNIFSAFVLPATPGVYFIHDFRGVLYIGESKNIKQRFIQHLSREDNFKLKVMISNPCGEVKFYWFEVPNKFKAIKMQKDWIRIFDPKCNNVKYNKYKEEMCQ